MAQLPTSRSIFDLQKYSRGLSRQTELSQHVQNSKDCDWHHHTQPVIRLLLESRNNLAGVPESVRIRVVWTLDKATAPESRPAQEFVIFEDVDLAIVRKHVHPFPTQGLPLKAVYRGNMVGVRYLPPEAKSNDSLEYRRFQVTFQEPSSAALLVDAIEKVCPCKLSPPNKSSSSNMPGYQYNNTNLGSQTLQTPQTHTQLYQQIITPQYRAALTTPPLTSECVPPAPQTAQSQLALPSNFIVPSQPSFPAQHVITNPNLANYSQPLSSNLTRHQTIAQESVFDQTFSQLHSVIRPDTLSRRHATASSNLNVPNIHDMQEQQSVSNQSQIVPLITPPPSSQAPLNTDAGRSPNEGSSAEPTMPVATSSAAKDPMITSLYEACRLDHLQTDELESLVAHIIREDGFPELLNKVDKLWRIKVLMNE